MLIDTRLTNASHPDQRVELCIEREKIFRHRLKTRHIARATHCKQNLSFPVILSAAKNLSFYATSTAQQDFSVNDNNLPVLTTTRLDCYHYLHYKNIRQGLAVLAGCFFILSN